MAKRADIIREARTWLKTPYRHQGRLKGIACDCAGLIIKVPVACGLYTSGFDIDGYSRFPDPPLMKQFLDRYMDRVTPAEPSGGDVLWLRPRRIPQHCAIYTFEGTIIHAIDLQRGVTEHRLDERWRRAISAVYRYQGIED